ncbi:putative protein N(5)-glutamine methyltransferase [Actinoalloteichus sp. AHMU CJ021]|uniref:putative protein N(5)-glutamine methyltransferase n=1 Tax=Actinoalloteichus TaxID=65496 RepID=UPI0004AA51F0|nr:putative protein N(5)-glutamine methyltransferase [Actinoalloteichus caeruleus]AUS80976.1 putative protein N(5)-glutamine methyltransferase [Actinoalloteichus sp. AHMU CJ021]
MPNTPTPPPSDPVVDALREAGCVFAEDEARLLRDAARTPAHLDALLRRRVAGLPLEHLLGWAEFAGCRVRVAPGVFVPRRRTEFLVDRAAEVTGPGSVVVDLCCGSGALGLALATRRPGIRVHASDIDPAAVSCARDNLADLDGQVFLGDLYAPLPAGLRGRVDVLLANVPYVPTREIALLPPEARLHEARAALDGGGDGLDLLRRVSARAEEWLSPGGHLLVETSDRQAGPAVAILRADGLDATAARSPDATATVVLGSAPAR